MLILVKIIKKTDFGKKKIKISILVKIDKNLEFGQNIRKISILVKIVGNSRFWWKLSISDKIAKKCWL